MIKKRYDSYKDSGVEWIGEIPNGWEITKIKNSVPYVVGGTPPSGDESYYGGVYWWVNISDMNGVDTITETRATLSEKGIFHTSVNLVPKGSLLYSFKLSVGSTAFAGTDLYTNEAIASFLRNDKVDLVFLRYAISTYLLNNANENIYGAKIMNQEIIRNAKISFPMIPEQQAIASYLDDKTATIDALIKKKKKQIKLLEEKRTALINQAVTRGLDPDVELVDSGVEWIGKIPKGWEVRKFQYLFELITEKNNEGKKIGLENISSNTAEFIDSETIFDGDGVSFQENDILFGKLRPYLAKVYLADFSGLAVGDFFVFRCRANILPTYGKYLILSDSFIELCNGSTFGAKMPRVNWEFISQLPIAYPNKEKQKEIIDKLSEYLRTVSLGVQKINHSIQLLTEYKQSLISHVVTGKVRIF